MGGARPTQRRAEHLVSVADLENLQRQLQGGRSTRHRHRMLAAHQRGDGMLEALDQRSLHQLSRFEHGSDGALLVLADPRFG